MSHMTGISENEMSIRILFYLDLHLDGIVNIPIEILRKKMQ